MAYAYALLYVALYKVNFNHLDISGYMAIRGTLLQRFEETEILKKNDLRWLVKYYDMYEKTIYKVRRKSSTFYVRMDFNV